jgi:hypothetical protein
VIDMCNQLLGRAIDLGASDVHVDCAEQGATVRFRICGVLEPMLSLPAAASHPIRNRYKIMARAISPCACADRTARFAEDKRACDRCSALVTADGGRRKSRHAAHRQPEPTAKPRAPRL